MVADNFRGLTVWHQFEVVRTGPVSTVDYLPPATCLPSHPAVRSTYVQPILLSPSKLESSSVGLPLLHGWPKVMDFS